jgi:leader peptidase (prepilin peptidase)/N-methyltransferase
MEIILTAVFVLFGTAVGSFLNVCIDRLPTGKSLVYPPSNCDACQRRLALKDLIPIFSYLWLRCRCRYCHTPILRRAFWVEAGSGLMFGFLYWYYGLSIELAVTAGYCCLFIVLGVIDMERKLILNKITYPAAVVSLIILSVDSFLPEPEFIGNRLFIPEPSIVSGVIGGGIGFSLLFMIAIVFRGGMGWGDVKMAGLIGLITGFPLAFVALFLGIVIGGLLAGILLLLKIKKRKEPIPFGPLLSLGAITTLLLGNDILNWYLGFF